MELENEINFIVAKYGYLIEPNSTISNSDFADLILKHHLNDLFDNHNYNMLLNTPMVIIKDANGRLKHKII